MLDLGQADIHVPVTMLRLRNFFGTITVLVPDATPVEIDDGVFLADHVTLPNQPPPASAPLIRIRTSGVGGTNYIRAATQAPSGMN